MNECWKWIEWQVWNSILKLPRTYLESSSPKISAIRTIQDGVQIGFVCSNSLVQWNFIGVATITITLRLLVFINAIEHMFRQNMQSALGFCLDLSNNVYAVKPLAINLDSEWYMELCKHNFGKLIGGHFETKTNPFV